MVLNPVGVLSSTTYVRMYKFARACMCSYRQSYVLVTYACTRVNWSIRTHIEKAVGVSYTGGGIILAGGGGGVFFAI